MKRKHREAMRAHADRQWDHVASSQSDAEEALNWHDEWLRHTSQDQQRGTEQQRSTQQPY
jgi:hypothetical protein